MAKKQAAKEQHTESHTVTRQYLSSSDNCKEIFYQYDEEDPAATAISSESSVETPPPAPSLATVPSTETKATPPAAVPHMVAATVEDVSMSSTDIVLAVVAQKLRKQFDQVPTSKSIQELSGGRLNYMLEVVGLI